MIAPLSFPRIEMPLSLGRKAGSPPSRCVLYVCVRAGVRRRTAVTVRVSMYRSDTPLVQHPAAHTVHQPTIPQTFSRPPYLKYQSLSLFWALQAPS